MEIPNYEIPFVKICYWCNYFESDPDMPRCVLYNEYVKEVGICPSWKKGI